MAWLYIFIVLECVFCVNSGKSDPVFAVRRRYQPPLLISDTMECSTSVNITGLCIRATQCYQRMNRKNVSPYEIERHMTQGLEPCGYRRSTGKAFIGVCCARPSIVDHNNNTGPHQDFESPTHGDKQDSDYDIRASGKTTRMSTRRPPSSGNTPPPDWIKFIGTWRPGGPTEPTTRRPTRRPSSSSTESPPDNQLQAACVQLKVSHGTEVKIHSYPWMAAIFNTERNRKRFFCGGSLITNHHILTAAHCLIRKRPENLLVHLGDHDVFSDSEANHLEYQVAEIIRHPFYRDHPAANDIAILKLASEVKLSTTVKRACLDISGERAENASIATVAGWGKNYMGQSNITGKLQHGDVPILTTEKCQELYEPLGKNGGTIDHRVICAGELGKDACVGDSGGPLMEQRRSGNWSTLTQIGVVSWGVQCGKYEYPGVYTRVYKFFDWINKTIKQ